MRTEIWMAQTSVLQIYRYIPALLFGRHSDFHTPDSVCVKIKLKPLPQWNPHHIASCEQQIANTLYKWKLDWNNCCSSVPVWSKLWFETKQPGVGCKLVQVRSRILGPGDHNWNFPCSSSPFHTLVPFACLIFGALVSWGPENIIETFHVDTVLVTSGISSALVPFACFLFSVLVSLGLYTCTPYLKLPKHSSSRFTCQTFLFLFPDSNSNHRGWKLNENLPDNSSSLGQFDSDPQFSWGTYPVSENGPWHPPLSLSRFSVSSGLGLDWDFPWTSIGVNYRDLGPTLLFPLLAMLR